MAWIDKHLAPTSTHLLYLLLSIFLLVYALASFPIRNNLHLSEPPLATLIGITFGPRGFNLLNPTKWGIKDNITQEATRVIVSLQVFSVGVELPRKYFSQRGHAASVAMMLGPVMAFSWLITAFFVWAVLRGTSFTTALIISACLAPTDPVLAASVLAESKFSNRVPVRLRHMLSAESGCNDGVSFPFLYLGLLLSILPTVGDAAKEWVLGTILWQCSLGLAIGLVIGKGFNIALKVSEKRNTISAPAFLVFYLLLALFAVGIGSTLGVDDFLVAFGAGYGFAYDGWFARKTHATHLPQILDLLLNSSMFIYFGAIIPWHLIEGPTSVTPAVAPGKLVGLLALILLFRRIPIVLALKPFIPDIKTWNEALFCGHFGPMGLGALFLVIEARAVLETGTSEPLPNPSKDLRHIQAIETIWSVVTFVILGSIMVHGLSVAAISVGGSLWRKDGERAPLLGQETDGLGGMVHEGGAGDSLSDSGAEEEEEEEDADGRREDRNRILS